jgi:hypothetical protein
MSLEIPLFAGATAFMQQVADLHEPTPMRV